MAVKKSKIKKAKKPVMKKKAPQPKAMKKAAPKVEAKVEPKKPVKAPTVTKMFNKSQIVKYLAEASCSKKKDITLLMEGLNEIIKAHLKKGGPGQFVFPGIAKFKVIHKPATKARQGTNPFTGEPTTFAARPARNVVKIRSLKKLKEMI